MQADKLSPNLKKSDQVLIDLGAWVSLGVKMKTMIDSRDISKDSRAYANE